MHRFLVAAPGYIVRLEGFSSIPTAYRWLDADGDVVWTQGFVSGLAPVRD